MESLLTATLAKDDKIKSLKLIINGMNLVITWFKSVNDLLLGTISLLFSLQYRRSQTNNFRRKRSRERITSASWIVHDGATSCSVDDFQYQQ